MSTLPLQKKADMITVPEDAIKAAIENYGDFIQNLVFDLSKYEDLLTQYIPALFEATQKPDPSVDNAFLKMAGFLFSESENMYMLKSTQFIRQAEELLNKKYTVIRTLIIKEGKENRFTFCENVFNIFSHHMVNIDWDRISLNIYKEKELSDFDKPIMKYFLSKKEECMKAIASETKYMLFEGTDLIKIIDNSFFIIQKSFARLRGLAENSSCTYVSETIVKEVLDIMVLVYACFKTIHKKSK